MGLFGAPGTFIKCKKNEVNITLSNALIYVMCFPKEKMHFAI